MKVYPTFQEEETLWRKGYRYVAGIDEVGRGCFAGPVVAAAVILPRSFPYIELINDSKLLTAPIREKLSCIIKLYAHSFSIVSIPVEVINEVGIGKASQLAFTRCAESLPKSADHFLLDAFPIKSIRRTPQKAIIHGDQISLSIAAASIIAKVYRDHLMQELHKAYPEYNFYQNKGYGTEEHREAIKKYGLSVLHRRSFALTPFLKANIKK